MVSDLHHCDECGEDWIGKNAARHIDRIAKDFAIIRLEHLRKVEKERDAALVRASRWKAIAREFLRGKDVANANWRDAVGRVGVAEIEVERLKDVINLQYDAQTKEGSVLLNRALAAEEALAWCIEGFEGMFGEQFWQSALGLRIQHSGVRRQMCTCNDGKPLSPGSYHHDWCATITRKV
jgi:hypothetical protein